MKKERKTMKKKVLSAMLIAAMSASLFAGCGNQGGDQPSNNTPNTQTPAQGGQ